MKRGFGDETVASLVREGFAVIVFATVAVLSAVHRSWIELITALVLLGYAAMEVAKVRAERADRAQGRPAPPARRERFTPTVAAWLVRTLIVASAVMMAATIFPWFSASGGEGSGVAEDGWYHGGIYTSWFLLAFGAAGLLYGVLHARLVAPRRPPTVLGIVSCGAVICVEQALRWLSSLHENINALPAPETGYVTPTLVVAIAASIVAFCAVAALVLPSAEPEQRGSASRSVVSAEAPYSDPR